MNTDNYTSYTLSRAARLNKWHRQMPLKAKAYNTCIAPQVAYRNCRGAGHDTERAGVGPIGRRLSLRPQADL